ncbi:MAG: cytochrome C, partial [Deltaproteobacteria bacterium]|nr:cytochrome C [Deltaproteobacteria bacterium]
AEEGGTCSECHCDPEIVNDGGRYLFIDPLIYQSTAHFEQGCPSCHQAVSAEHPDDGIRPSRAACKECHDEVAAEYDACGHAANADCTDCHNPHRVQAVTAVSGPDMNRVCDKCHDHGEIAAGHARWLPQAELHIRALPCIACHTSSESYVITFYPEVMKKGSAGNAIELADYQKLCQAFGDQNFSERLDRDGNGVVSLIELRDFNRLCRKLGLRLWGMMTPAEAGHCYATLDNRWDCTFCHASGAGATQTSYVAFPDAGGSYQRIAVESGAALETVYGTPDFYMIGASRNPGLRVIGLLIIAAGMMMPIGHGFLRLLTIKNRRKE